MKFNTIWKFNWVQIILDRGQYTVLNITYKVIELCTLVNFDLRNNRYEILILYLKYYIDT